MADGSFTFGFVITTPRQDAHASLLRKAGRGQPQHANWPRPAREGGAGAGTRAGKPGPGKGGHQTKAQTTTRTLSVLPPGGEEEILDLANLLRLRARKRNRGVAG